MTEFAVETKVIEGTITRSFGFRFNDRIARCKAADPLEQDILYFEFTVFENFFSNLSISGPDVNQLLRKTLVTAWMSLLSIDWRL